MRAASRIVVSGYTAAGKTTHARLLAAALKWRYIGMAEVMADVSGVGGGLWTPEIDRARAEDPSIDRRADARMTELVADSTDVVVDAWLQPWLLPAGSAVGVWLESSRSSRSMKCVVSYLRRGARMGCSDAAGLLRGKDTFSTARFRDLYGVGFRYDPVRFALWFDNSKYIAEPTVQASDRGIELSQSALLAGVHELL